jgi:putative zinc finger protein
MDCREFKQKHVAFVDDLLPGLDLVQMQRHLIECEQCSHHDTQIRRALLVVRNMPEIRPSADFSTRLETRLRLVRPETTFGDRATGHPRLTTFTAIATGVIAAGVLSITMVQSATPPRDISLPPVVASLPEIQAEPYSSPLAPSAMMASASTGIGIWPAVLVAEQAPLHFAASELRLVNYTQR